MFLYLFSRIHDGFTDTRIEKFVLGERQMLSENLWKGDLSSWEDLMVLQRFCSLCKRSTFVFVTTNVGLN